MCGKRGTFFVKSTANENGFTLSFESLFVCGVKQGKFLGMERTKKKE